MIFFLDSDVGWLRRARRLARPWVYRARHQFRRISEWLRPIRPWDGLHHPVLEKFTHFEGEADGHFMYDAFGTRIDPSFRVHFRSDPKGHTIKAFPSPSSTYFELIFLLESVVEAVNAPERPFVMVELGAGYGPWLVTAHRALAEIAPEKSKTFRRRRDGAAALSLDGTALSQ